MKQIFFWGLMAFLLTTSSGLADDQLPERFENLYEAMLTTGLEALNQERYVEAEKIFQRIISAADDPEATRPHIYLGICQNRMQQFEKGIKSLEIAIKRNTSFRDMVDFHLGIAYAKMKNPRAMVYLDGYIQAHPEDPTGYETIGAFILENPRLSQESKKGCGYLRKACLLGRCEALEFHKKENRCSE